MPQYCGGLKSYLHVTKNFGMASAPPGQGGLKMFDLNEIRKQAQQAKEQALDAVKETMEKIEERINEIEVPGSEKSASISAAEVEEQISVNTQRQVEILGQIFSLVDAHNLPRTCRLAHSCLQCRNGRESGIRPCENRSSQGRMPSKAPDVSGFLNIRTDLPGGQGQMENRRDAQKRFRFCRFFVELRNHGTVFRPLGKCGKAVPGDA